MCFLTYCFTLYLLPLFCVVVFMFAFFVCLVVWWCGVAAVVLCCVEFFNAVYLCFYLCKCSFIIIKLFWFILRRFKALFCFR